MISAFMTSKNKPKVNRVTGRVNKIKMGLTNKFKSIRTAATTIAVTKLSTSMPGKIFASTTTAIALRTILMSVFDELDCSIIMLIYKKNC